MKIFTFIFCCFFYLNSFAKETVTLANGEWASYLSSKETYYGVWSRLVSEAFAKNGIAVSYEFFPWSRALEIGKNGRNSNIVTDNCCDGTLLWRKTEEREKDFYISDPVLENGYVFFAMKGLKNKKGINFENIQWKDLKDLKEFSMGATYKFDYGEEFDALEKNKIIKVESAASELKNFQKLEKEKIDIVPVTLEIGLSIIKNNFNWKEHKDFVYNPALFAKAPMYLLLSKKDPKNKILMEKFNAGLKELKNTGRYAAILHSSN